MRVRRTLRCLGFLALLGAIPAPVYCRPPQPGIFTGPELTQIFHRIVLPEYPYEARRAYLSGRGTYRAHVKADGTVARVEVIKSTGNRSLDEAVVAAARRWRTKPGRKFEVDFPMAFVAPRPVPPPNDR